LHLLSSSKFGSWIFAFGRYDVEFNRKLIKKGPNVQLKIDHVLNPTCLVIRQEAQGDHNGHDWQGQKAEVARQFVAERDREEDGDIPKYDQEMGESRGDLEATTL
jgi:hypothetical protein